MNRPAPDFTFYYNDDALIEACQLEKAAVIFGNPNREQLSCCKNLKWVQLGSAGADAYVKEGFLPAGTILTNASGAYGPAIAEYMVAVSFSLFNNLPLYRDNQLSAYGESAVQHAVSPVQQCCLSEWAILEANMPNA